MAGDRMPSVRSLDKPEDLKSMLKKDRADDCLSCKVVGTTSWPWLLCNWTLTSQGAVHS